MRFTYRNKHFFIKSTSNKDWIYQDIVQHKRFYEIHLLEYIYSLRLFIRGDHCIDVGANIGNHSIFLGSFIKKKILSFECNDKVIPVLKENLNNNNINYKVYENAIGKKNELGELIMPPNSENNIGMAKINIINKSNKNSINIVTLDSIIDDYKNNNTLKRVGLLKIDVEGMELDVLKGSNNLLMQYKPHIFVEAQNKKAFLILKSYLEEKGYHPLSVFGSTPVYHFAYKPTFLLKTFIKFSIVIKKIRGK